MLTCIDEALHQVIYNTLRVPSRVIYFSTHLETTLTAVYSIHNKISNRGCISKFNDRMCTDFFFVCAVPKYYQYRKE